MNASTPSLPDREPRYDTEVDLAKRNTSQTQIVLLTGRDKKVLDVGPATGYVARALRQRRCRVTGIEVDAEAAAAAARFCERMIVGDVEEVDFQELFGTERFDVVIFGDVLEHLRDPHAVLQRTAGILAPGGYVVASIPNITHGSVRLLLHRGEFRYTDRGILDRTHRWFFDRRGVEELFGESGYGIREWRRVLLEVFEPPEADLREEEFPPQLVEEITRAPEARTYQFVVRAQPVRVTATPRPADGRSRTPVTVMEIGADDATELEGRLTDALTRLTESEARYRRVVDSTGFRLLERLRAFIGRIAPWGTRRRQVALLPSKASRVISREGLPGFFRRLLRVWAWMPALVRPALPKVTTPDERYELWLYLNALAPARLRATARTVRRLSFRPTFSIVIATYETDPEWLWGAVESVRRQIYPKWELCIADDGSTREDTLALLRELETRDPRIRVTYGEHRGIAGATNAALSMARGAFVGFLDHDDELKPNALAEVAKLLNVRRDLDYIYSDEDKKDVTGRLTTPFFKPGWSPDLLTSVNYVTHFSVYRKEILDRLGGLRAGYEGSQDFDLALRATELTDRIGHVPLPLYSWRKVPGSAAASLSYKTYAYEAGRRALADALRRRGHPGSVEDGLVEGRYRVRYEIRGDPEVLIVIPTRDRLDLLERCVESVERTSTYPNYRLLVVDNGSTERDTLQYLERFGGEVLRHPGEFNFARMMNAAAARSGGAGILLFLNNDTEVISPEWIEAMVEHAQRSEVAAVGARLLFPDGEPQHEGIVVGIGGAAARNLAHPYFGLGETVRNCSAVSAACMATRTEVFRELGGFEERLAVAFNDVDFCLRAREKGYEVVYTPHAVLYHDEGSSRGVGGSQSPEDERFFRARWSSYRDPFYHPAFDPNRPFELNLSGETST
ncbi:MAG TPA: glycosyltransferase [Actinomycetota bacterium]|nr:glycosyltransferase [Actinomycetota bacterium]